MWEGLFRVGAGGQRTPLSDRLRYPPRQVVVNAGGWVLGARDVLQKAKDPMAMQAQRVLDGRFSCIYYAPASCVLKSARWRD
jgi:hypothetical protein